MRSAESSTGVVIYAAGLVTVVGSLLLWVCWFYPRLALDYASILPAMWEMRDAFARFGVLDVDFSPFRCLGLPVFANPNAFVWSVFHLFALVLPPLPGTVAGATTILVFGYVGCVALLRGLGLGAGLTTALAVGWCLQGFCASHLIAGHASFVQLALQPLLLWVLMQRAPSWVGRGLVAFWLAHLVYGSGYYLLLTGIPSLLLAAAILELLVPARLAAANRGGLGTVAWNLAGIGALALAMCLPKILAVLDFTAMFPRLTHLDRIATWKALVYTASQYFVPVAWDVRRFAGWWYGNWESYEIILPGVACWLAWVLWARRRDLPVRGALGVFVLLLALGTMLSSGVLAPASSRWIAAFWAIAVLASLQFFDARDMQIEYTDGQGIDATTHRLGFCYEPIFGYRLEQFPVRGEVDFTSDVPVDPRCYLRSAGCAAGTLLTTPADREALLRYALRDTHPPVAFLKWPALAVYLVGFGCALVWLIQAMGELLSRS
jgi:hypothetical protein